MSPSWELDRMVLWKETEKRGEKLFAGVKVEV